MGWTADLLDATAYRQIQYHAQQIAKQIDTRGGDTDDVAGELTLHVLRQLDHYDPHRGAFSTFLRQTLRRKTLDLLRYYRRIRRTPAGPVLSLSADIEEACDQDVVGRQHGSITSSFEDAVLQRVDIERALSQLSPVRRQLCQQLMVHSQAEVAAAMGVSRFALARDCQGIQAELKKVGLAVISWRTHSLKADKPALALRMSHHNSAC